ncbi:hypothetical protein SAMN05421736_105134 [Evansella caseinilytica]|uniref:DUF2087 domain-containing protein n=1 Tax=Evansella caseinilytica TaxID=1503961 RepID=A0A1H3PN99_9BACI|nr:DUF2087 domain-containing protein [Evansella caseinilytica]SDZ02732.1 hypothetical protein SAMN05421736_105134 [Evansella caseinilytica]
MAIEKASMEELKKGYTFQPNLQLYHCLFCTMTTEKGRIYGEAGAWFDAERYMKEHVYECHGSPFHALLELDKRLNGLSAVQKEILSALYEGKTDKQITAEQGAGSPATVRQHRFKLREKEKQAKFLLTIMELLNEKNEVEAFAPIHKGATMVDERWLITEVEEKKVLQTYVDASSRKVKQFPAKEKRKIILLKYIFAAFEKGKKYTEKEVNEMIKQFYDDYVTIRRYFIEYGFLDRNRDGSAYWVKE